MMLEKKVLLNVNEFYDIPTMKLLYDYLVSTDLDAKIGIFLHPRMRYSEAEQSLGSVPILEFTPHDSLVVSDFSDLKSACIGLNNVEVDRSILRSFVLPLAREDKEALRGKYNVPLERKVVTVDYDCAHLMVGHVNEIIEALYEDAHIYILGGIHSLKHYKIKDKFHKGEQKVHLVLKNKLKMRDYYTIADLAINAAHAGWGHSPDSTFDFVNATEGGPLFMSKPPGDVKIFGFDELANMGAIRLFDYKVGRSWKLEAGSHTEQYFKEAGMPHLFAGAFRDCSVYDLAFDAKEFLQSFEGNEEHAKKRAEFISQAKGKYLPVILSQIKKRLGQNTDTKSADLTVEENEWVTRLTHANTVWARGMEKERPLYDPRQPYWANDGANRYIFVRMPYKKGQSPFDIQDYDKLPKFRDKIDIIGPYVKELEAEKGREENNMREWEANEKAALAKIKTREQWHKYRRARHGGCFLTTACVKYKGLPDDCNELETLRKFRDEKLLTTKKGKCMVEQYYALAPLIIEKINNDNMKYQVYSGIYQNIIGIMALIEERDYSGAIHSYKKMVEDLHKKYFGR